MRSTVLICNLRLRKPVSLPPSLSDATPILFPRTSDSKEDSEELYEELDEERAAAESDEEIDYDSEPLPGIQVAILTGSG